MKRNASRFIAVLLVAVMLVSAMPICAFAATPYDPNATEDDYYKLISQRDWDLAPGISESETILNNEEGTLRQVVHTLEIDLNNPYTKVIPGYKGMIPTPGKYGIQSVSEQAAYAEANGYGNVVAATNCSLSWYNSAYYVNRPELVGEPLGYMILDGQMFVNSQGQTYGAVCCIVINYNNHPVTGEPRPDSIPRVTIRNTKDAITGWEEQVIPVNFTFLVKDTNGDGIGENQYKNQKNHTSGFESRTFVGVRADGTLVVAVVDGRQSPYSMGFNSYEMADYMIKQGCIVAANCDGGGSTEFMSQRPGEDLKINCSLSDGGERPTTNTILVISTAPSNGELANAVIETDYDYYTPGSTVKFDFFGTDMVGTKVDIPADATWTLVQEDMGSISDGVFVSNGTEGKVTAQLSYNGKVIGEHSIVIANPDTLSFSQPIVTIPYGEKAMIPVKATMNGLYEIGLSADDVIVTSSNPALGTVDGLHFIGVEKKLMPADNSTTVTVTLKADPSVSATATLKLGDASVVMWDFEDGQADVDEWNCIVLRNPGEDHRDFYHNLSLATREDGQVHDGNYSMRLETNGLSSSAVHSQQYAYVRLGIDGKTINLENARSIGFWLYVPEDNIQCWVQGFYKYDTNGDGVPDTLAEVNMMTSETVYYNVDESGWVYLSMDLSAFEKVALEYKFDKDPSDGKTGATGDFFFAIIFHKAINNMLWQNSGSVNGPMTYYIDSVTVDYSEIVEDREAPVFGSIVLDNNGTQTRLEKRKVTTTTSNIVSAIANVEEAYERVAATGETSPLYNYTGLNPASAKAYIDGVEVPCEYKDGQIVVPGVAVADGFHRIKFEICDNAGNKSVKIRVIEVKSGVNASTIHVVPADATLDRIAFGSVYWMNMEATNIETIQSVSAVIDLNNVNHWELDHMIVAEGFSAEYFIEEETNTATLTITRTGENNQKGAAVLAYLPVRIIYFDTDMNIPGYDATTVWTKYKFWPHDMKMDVDKGVITYVDGYNGTVKGIFSNEEFSVDTEMYTDLQSIDKIYLAEHGSTHVHTPVAADKAPTCEGIGYAGGTFCEVCQSPVEWGEVLAPLGHEYAVVGGKLVCTVCGDVYSANGLVSISGNAYYMAGETLINGWVTVNDEWYYFDTATYAAVETLFNGYVTYEFEKDGKLISGQWYHTSKGSRYYYGPTYFTGRTSAALWLEIDGKKYCFPADGYCYTGIRWVDDNVDALYEWYEFDTDGALIGFADVEGLTEFEGKLYYVVDHLSADGLRKVGNDYYYFPSAGDYRAAVTNVTRYCAYTYCDLPAGTYTFGADGKMLHDILYTVDGVLYYYLKGNVCGTVGSIEINGQSYEVESTGKVLYTGVYTDSTGATRYYENGVAGPLNGLVGDYFYINGVPADSYYGLVEWQGSFYYVNEGGKIVRDARKFVNKPNGLTYSDGTPIPRDYFYFDADGKMIIEDRINGPVDGYFYKDGKVLDSYYGLVEWEGDFYYVDAWGMYVVSARKFINKPNGLTFANGTEIPRDYFYFDADGKMIVKQGIADDTYYINGISVKPYYGLVEWEGNYYYVDAEGTNAKIVKNVRKYVRNTNGLTFPDGSAVVVGYYEFDAEGKMILKQGFINDQYYVNGIPLPAYYGLIEDNGYFYYLNDYGKPIKNARKFVNKTNGLTFADGTPIPQDYFYFDAEGKMVIEERHNGPVDGYFYKDGKVLNSYYGLVEWKGDFYYVDAWGKYIVSDRKYVNKPNGLTFADGSAIPQDYFYFDADGKMIIEERLNGPVDGYFYKDGKVLDSYYGLVEWEGDFYYVDAWGKYVVSDRKYVNKPNGLTFADGTPIPQNYFYFDADGKMIID